MKNKKDDDHSHWVMMIFFLSDKSKVTYSDEGRVILSASEIVGIVVGTFIVCLVVGASITTLLIVWVGHMKRSKRKRKRVRIPISVRKHQVYDQLSLNSPGLEKLQQFEFPRSNLELQEVLGMW